MKKKLTLKSMDEMTPAKFLELSIEDQYEFLSICRYDMEIVRDLIRDRNLFRDCYYELSNQLIKNGIKPCVDYYAKSETGRKK